MSTMLSIMRGINGARSPLMMRGINGARAVSNFSSNYLETKEESEWLREKLLERKEMERRLKINELEMNELEMKKKLELSEIKIGRLIGWEIKKFNHRSPPGTYLPPQESGSKVADGSRSLEPNGQEQRDALSIDNITRLIIIRLFNALTGVFQGVTIRMELYNKYSIPKCMEVYQSIGGFTSHEDSKVYHLFNDEANREFFLSLQHEKRVEWLRNMFARI